MSSEQMDIESIMVAFKQNVDVRDRRYRLRTYKKCFVATEAVDFLVKSGISNTREEAVELGKTLQGTQMLFRHVVGQHMFADEYLFFEYTPQADKKMNGVNGTTPNGVHQHGMSKQDSQKVFDLYGVKDKDDDSAGPTFADQNKKKMLTEASGDDSERFKALVKEAATKAVREIQMAEQVNKQLLEVAGSVNAPLQTDLKPQDMRCLALVAHNHMKPAMKRFIEGHSEILKNFRLTGTNTTMTMCRTVFGEENPDIVYGPTATSGPLGGDAQLAALLCLEDVGAIIFFMDPLSPHPHQADIDSLIRLANVHNVILCTNPTTAVATMWMIRQCLVNNQPEMFPSFFETLESPSVPEYKAGQKKALENAINS